MVYAFEDAAMKSLDMSGLVFAQRKKMYGEFMGELRLSCAVRHPCVITVHGAFT